MIGTQLRSEFTDIAELLSENIELVKDLYNECLAASFDQDIGDEESHIVFCTLVSVCLLYDKHDICFPMAFQPEDEQLLGLIISNVDILMTIEAMADKNVITRQVIDGKTYYSAPKNDKT